MCGDGALPRPGGAKPRRHTSPPSRVRARRLPLVFLVVQRCLRRILPLKERSTTSDAASPAVPTKERPASTVYRRKIGRFQIPHQQPVVAQKQRVVPPSGFAQRRQHLRPDRLVALFVFREPPRPHLQQKAYTFDHFTSASGIFNSDASLPMRARLWPTPSAQWCVGPSIDQRLMNSAGPNENRSRELVLPMRRIGPGSDSPSAPTSLSLPSAVCVKPRIVTGPVFTLNSTETPEPRLPWYKPSPRSTGRASLMAMWPGPSCPISTKLSRKSIA